MYERSLVTAPTVEPITVQDVKDNSNIESDFTDHDVYIDTLILAARTYIEKVLNRALITQTWDVYLDAYKELIELPKAPLQSVTSITYTDTDGNSQTEASSVYTVDSNSNPGRIYLAYNQSWSTIRDIRNSITIRIIAGYGDEAEDVPQPIRHAMLLMVGHLYENRESTSVLTVKEVPLGFNELIAPYKVY